MITVKLLGILRIELGISELAIEPDVKNVTGLIERMATMLNKTSKELRDNIIFVNDTNIHSLRMFRTPLKDNDMILFLAPVSGG